jgi:hypothetical protein
MWQLLSAREASLQPGEMLLPKLQQQLMQALGCHSKGFLWLAAVWIGEQRQISADVDKLVLRAIICASELALVLTSRKGEEQQQQVAPEQVQQCKLLPVLLLRWALQRQRDLAAGRGAAICAAIATRAAVDSLGAWELLSGQCEAQQATCTGQGVEEQGSAVLPPDVAFEMVTSGVQLLLDTIRGVYTKHSSSCAGGGSSSSSSSSFRDSMHVPLAGHPDFQFYSEAVSFLTFHLSVFFKDDVPYAVPRSSTCAVPAVLRDTPTRGSADTGVPVTSWTKLLLRATAALSAALCLLRCHRLAFAT